MVFRVADFEGGATPPTPTPVILKKPLPQKINKRQGEKGKRKPDNQTCKKFFNNLQVHFTSIGVCCIYVCASFGCNVDFHGVRKHQCRC